MPRAQWGVSRGVISEFDRDSQFKPYAGPEVPNGVYRFRIKTLKRTPKTKDKLPQLRPGLELVPRSGRPEERKYRGFYITAFLPVSDQTDFRYVPFLDAIGVSEADFLNRTMVDEQGNVKRIGSWRMDGETEILAQLKDGEDQRGNPRQEVGTFLSLENDFDEDDDEDEEYDDEDESDEDDDEDYED